MWGRRRVDVLLDIVPFFVCSVLLLRATAQEGFISIDCGSSTEYYEDSIGINWVGDENYTSTGENAVVDISKANLGADRVQNQRTLQTLRYFVGPASKNCYNIPLLNIEKHLIRLTFLGGNLTSGTTTPPAFSISLGTAHWQDVQVSDPWTPIVMEASFYALQSPLPICFQRGASGDPFINSIEIRPLPSSSYQFILNTFIYTTMFRQDCGRKSGSPSTRYPDDASDRIWQADPKNASFPSFTNVSASIDTTSATNDPPLAVFQSAWNASEIAFTWTSSDLPSSPTDSRLYYIAFYFAEIAGLQSSRVLDVYVDGDLYTDGPIKPSDSAQTEYTFRVEGSTSNASVVPNDDSSVPVALLNAVEAYRVQMYNTSWSTSEIAVKAIEAIKQQLNLTQWQGDPCLVWPYDWLKCSDPALSNTIEIETLSLSKFNLRGTIPQDIADLVELQELALDSNNFTGILPDISGLSKLKYLRLQNNRLTGPIPEYFGSLQLSVLTLDNNLFEGGVPAKLQEKIDSGVLTFSATNNPFLCFGGNLCLQPPAPSPLPNNDKQNNDTQNSDKKSSDKKSSNVGVIIGVVAGGVVVLLVALLLFSYKCLRKSAPKTGGGRGESIQASSNQLKSFSWAEVTTATRNFSQLLGKGGYGNVFLGELPDGRKVAVKVNKENTKHGSEQFLNEVALLSRVHHRHLVSFVGYCNEGNHEILVYDYMAQGTLQDHLTGMRITDNGPLDWRTRLDIVLNASKGVEYLHKSCNPSIIHRDIKTANILLTEHLVAKVSDFGISKPTTEEDRTCGVTTAVMGTFGYLDPEYVQTRRLNQKSDVYSFGVVLLEVITGKPPTTVRFPNSRASNLLEWVQSRVRGGDIGSITDPAMGSNYKAESVWKVTELALACLRPNLSERPDMTRVLQELTEAMEHETHQTTVTVYPSPSNLPPSAYDQYQRVSEAPRTVRVTSRGDSSRTSQESIATFSTNNITPR